MCTPGASHSPRRIGVVAEVATTITSAPPTASSAEAAACTLNSRANRSALRGLQTLTSVNSRTSRSASRWLRACTPEPRIVSAFVSLRAGHGGNQILHPQKFPNFIFREDHWRTLHGRYQPYKGTACRASAPACQKRSFRQAGTPALQLPCRTALISNAAEKYLI